MPKLAAFPKLYMQALCKDGTMSIAQWVDAAAELPIDGLEWYAGFLGDAGPIELGPIQKACRIERADDSDDVLFARLHSPGRRLPSRANRERKFLDRYDRGDGRQYCRVLSGQRRPEVSRADGIAMAAAVH